MKSKRFYILIFLFLHTTVNAQVVDTTLEKLISKFEKTKLITKEKVYLQFNKSLYLTDEIIYFQVYTIDQKTGLPSSHSQKVYTELFNQKGNLIQRKTWHNKEGILNGNFELEDTLTSGFYLVRSYTNWMRNWNPKSYFYTWIEIQSSKKSEPTIEPIMSNSEFIIQEQELPLSCVIDTSQNGILIYKLEVKNKRSSSMWHALLHSNEEFLDGYTIPFETEKSVRAKIHISINKLRPGLNQLTFFDHQLTPVFEKTIWRPLDTLHLTTEIRQNSIKDSLQITITNNADVELAGAISLLPKETYSADFKDNIITSLLMPYHIREPVKGILPQFIEMSSTKINQELQKYSFINPEWKWMFNDSIFKAKYETEQRFTVDGKVTYRYDKKPQTNSKVILISPSNNLLLETFTDKKGKFSFKNLYLKDDSSMMLSASLEGKTFECHIHAQIQKTDLEDKIDTKQYYQFQPPLISNTTIAKSSFKRKGYKFVRTIELKDVEIKGKKENPYADDPSIPSIADIYLVGKEEVKKYQNIDDFLVERCKLIIYYAGVEGGPGVVVREGYMVIGKQIEVSPRSGPPAIIIDGQRASLSRLFGLSVAEIELVAVNTLYIGSFAGHKYRQYGSITIKTRPVFLKGEGEPNPVKLIADEGFNLPLRYPKNKIYSETDTNYRATYWTPMDLDSFSNYNLKIGKDSPNQLLNLEVIDLNSRRVMSLKRKLYK